MRLLSVLLAYLCILFAAEQDPADLSYLNSKVYSKKVTPLLKMQLNLKHAYLDKTISKLPKIVTADEHAADKQQIFLYYENFPDAADIGRIENLGGTVYPDTWIPPVGIHPYGYLLASVPIGIIETLEKAERLKKLDTAERQLYPKNDSAAVFTDTDDVRFSGFKGTGVRIAILDSGIDTDHPDFPAPIEAWDYSAYPAIDGTVANTVTAHGTHVAGTVLGRGIQSSGKYQGVAPEADLLFFKIGSDDTGSASTAAITNAIGDAVDVYGADIITMSYGGWSRFHDGTSTEDQAVDYAVSQGATVFISAGNEANDGWHYSGTVAGSSTSTYIQVTVTDAGRNDTALFFNLVWYDGLGTQNDLDLNFYNASYSLLSSDIFATQSESERGTESKISNYSYFVPRGNSTYYLQVVNNSISTQTYHLYFYPWADGGIVVFNQPDPYYTIASPATADNAICVGAHTSRRAWTDYQDDSWTFGEQVNQICSFSSRGPRVDENQTVTLTAPGSAIISAKDSDVSGLYNELTIDNDGINNGLGPADYYVMQGTSMACPHAAGAAALLLQHDATLTPVQVKNLLINNTDSDAFTGTTPNNTWGYGKLNIQKAMEALLPGIISTMQITAGGFYSFGDTDVSMNFTTSGSNGYVAVAAIENTPAGGSYNVDTGLDHVSTVRYWQIHSDKSGFTTSVSFAYNPELDQILDETALKLATRSDDGDHWQEYTDITLDTDNDQITANNVTGFSQWIFADTGGDNPLPVSLSRFTAHTQKGAVILDWQAEAEIGVMEYNLMRSQSDSNMSGNQALYAIITFPGIGARGSNSRYEYKDTSVRPDQHYYYLLQSVDYNGKLSIYGPVHTTVMPPKEYALAQNYPNPFNNATIISYQVSLKSDIELSIYNLLGQKVVTLVSGRQQAGRYQVTWNGEDDTGNLAGSGVYYYRMRAKHFSQVRKMLLIQ